MLADDLTAIRTHFLDTFGADSSLQIVMANQPATTIDKSNIWSRFSINVGACSPYITGYYEQLGLACLQVMVPLGMGTTDGYVLADRYLAAFRNWRSDDNQTRAYKSDTSIATDSDNFIITTYVYWSSIRADNANL